MNKIAINKILIKEQFIVALLLILSFIIRMIYIFQIKNNPFFSSPLGDPLYFDRWASEIINVSLIGKTVYFKAPLYPYFLALIYFFSDHSYLAPRIVQVFLGIGISFLVYLIAKHLFGKKTAFLALFLTAFNGILIYFGGEILIPSLLTFLILLFFYLFQKARIKESKLLYFLSGLSLGFSAIARPNILLFIPFLFLYMFCIYRKKSILNILFISLGLILIVFPVTLRNYIVCDDFILISAQGSVILFIGNNEYSDGKSAVIPEVGDDWDEVSIAEREAGRPLKPSEVSNYWLVRSIEYIRENPLHFVKLNLKKTLYFFNGYEIGNNQDIYSFGKYSSLIRLLIFKFNIFKRIWFYFPTGLLFPFALAGIVLAVFIKKKNITLYIIYLLTYSFSIIIFFVCSRYRVPLFPVLIMFSSYFIVSFYNLIKRKKYRNIIFISSFLLIMLLLGNFRIDDVNISTPAMEYYNLGLIHLKDENHQKAIEEFNKTISINPNYQRAHLNIGLSYFKLGEFDRAIHEYEKEIEINPGEARSYNNLAVIYSLKGENQIAIDFWLKSIELRPRFEEPYINLGIKYENLDSLNNARQIYHKLLLYNPLQGSAHLGLGRIFSRLSVYDSSMNHYLSALEIDKDNSEIYYNIGVLYISMSFLDSAEIFFLKAIEKRYDLPQAHHNLGLIYMHREEYNKAVIKFEIALKLDPELIESHMALQRLQELMGH